MSDPAAPSSTVRSLRVALVVEGGPMMRVPILRAAPMLKHGLGDLVVVTVRDDPDLTDLLADQGIAHRSLGANTSRGYPRAAVRLAGMIRGRRIDIVHGVEPIAAVIANMASILARRGGRLFDRQHSRLDRRGRLLSRLAAQSAHLIRVPSSPAVDWAVAEDRISREKVRLVYNASSDAREVADEEVAELRAGLGIAPEDRVVCSVARLRAEKQLEVGIAARDLLAARLPTPVHYVIVGEGPDRRRLEAIAAGNPRVHMVGHRDEIWPWYASADLAWMPSANESLSIAAAEALAIGVPLIASRVGGLVDVVGEDAVGRLVLPGSAEELAAASLEILEDPQLRRRLSTAARARYQDLFSGAAVIPRMHRCYELVARPGSTPSSSIPAQPPSAR